MHRIALDDTEKWGWGWGAYTGVVYNVNGRGREEIVGY